RAKAVLEAREFRLQYRPGRTAIRDICVCRRPEENRNVNLQRYEWRGGGFAEDKQLESLDKILLRREGCKQPGPTPRPLTEWRAKAIDAVQYFNCATRIGLFRGRYRRLDKPGVYVVYYFPARVVAKRASPGSR